MSRYAGTMNAGGYENGDDGKDEQDWQLLAFEYSNMLGVLISVVGPQTLTIEDIELYKRAELRIVIDYLTPGEVKFSLLGDDEYEVAMRTGRNPREDA